jgi:hypothetical protein
LKASSMNGRKTDNIFQVHYREINGGDHNRILDQAKSKSYILYLDSFRTCCMLYFIGAHHHYPLYLSFF